MNPGITEIPHKRAKELAIEDAEKRFKWWDEGAQFWTKMARDVGDTDSFATMRAMIRCRSLAQDHLNKVKNEEFIGGHWMIEAQS